MARRSLVCSASIVAFVALAMSGCTPPADSPSSSKLSVVATTTQLGDFANEVGGEQIELTTLLSPGASAHGFELTPADKIALIDADVLIMNGLELDSFVEDVIDSGEFAGELINVSERLLLEEPVEGETDHTTDADADADHAHGSINPHIWTSPVMASDMVEAIAAGLSVADPVSADVFAANAKVYEEKLDQLDTWIEDNIEQVPDQQRVVVSGHNSLEYYLEAYDITFAGSILPSFEDNAEPSVAERNALIQAIKDQKVTAIFVESSMNPKTAEIIAKETGATLVSEDVLYADSLGVDGSGAETYIKATVKNTRTLLEAWGFAPLPLSAELEAMVN